MLASMPEAAADSLEQQALNACRDLERKISTNNIDLIEAQRALKKAANDALNEEDPDRDYKDEHDSDAEGEQKKRGRGRGRGRGRSEGRGRGRGRKAHDEHEQDRQIQRIISLSAC